MHGDGVAARRHIKHCIGGRLDAVDAWCQQQRRDGAANGVGEAKPCTLHIGRGVVNVPNDDIVRVWRVAGCGQHGR